MGENLGSRIELEVSNVAHGGVMVARHEGRVVFVADAIPGERVLAEITDDSKAKFWRADAVQVLESSEHRRPHVWSAASIDRAPADRAGGAEFGHIDLEHQRELKRHVLTDSLKRMGRVDADVTVESIEGEPTAGAPGTGWRTRLHLHVADDGTVGPFAARSHRVIPVDDVPLATEQVQAIAPLDERFPGATSVEVIAPSVGNPWVLSGGSKRSTITERVGDRDFKLDVRGFWQVHRNAAQTLTEAVQWAIDPELFDARATNLDLYGGVGLLAAAVGDRFGPATRITTVESDPSATDHASGNLVEWVGARAITARVDRYLSQLVKEGARMRDATVVLDPPRSGAGRPVVDRLADLGPAQLVYVACDPVALARDVALFTDRGYRLERIRAFDLFPHTHHVEAVAALVRE